MSDATEGRTPTEKPKSAEDWAKEILDRCRTELSKPPNARKILVEALNDFAAERVKEAIVKEYEGDCSNVSMIEHKAYQKGHYEALEEAAKVCNSSKVCGCSMRIRRLKDTPPK